MPPIFNGGEIVLISLVAPVKANPCPIPVMIVATIKTSRDFNGVGLGMILGLTSFIGYGGSAPLGEEATNPKAITRSLTFGLFIVATIMTGIGQGFAFTGATREIRTISPPLKMGGILSNYYIIIYFGVGAPTVILGILDKISGLFQGILYYGSALIIISLVIIIFLHKYKIKIVKD